MCFSDCLSTTNYVSGDMTPTHVRKVAITHFGYEMAAYTGNKSKLKTDSVKSHGIGNRTTFELFEKVM